MLNYTKWFLGSTIFILLFPAVLPAQQNRIVGSVDRLRSRALRGNVHPSARLQYDAGPLDPSLRLDHVMLMFKRSGAQQASLDQLLSEQQTPSSPSYHKWISPEQFADRFGISPNDSAKISAWLQSEGLAVDEISRGRNWVEFSGTVGQIQAALHTNLRRYRINSELHFANSDELSVPSAIEPLVEGVLGLDDFRATAPQGSAVPFFTSTSGSHSLAPDDFATIYNLNPLYNSGYDGSGQSIVVAGQSAVDLADIQLFRSIYNLPKNDPQLLLVPGSVDPGKNSAQSEGDLDLEWAGAVARNARIIYVYSSNVMTMSVPYAINQNLAPIITYSFGNCEQHRSASSIASIRGLAQQANAQGITWVAASGDSGAANCDPAFQPSFASASQGLSVSFPASLPEVTGVGGTQFNTGNVTYWNFFNSNNLASALSYIPETSWNGSGPSGLSATGGGLSVDFARPSWQNGAGVSGVNRRAVPDISMSAGGGGVGYRAIMGGQSFLFLGTSTGTPSFAGILALVNQYQLANGVQTQSGQGNINPNLYSLAQTTPGIFHDITTGSNIVACVVGTLDCSTGSFGYSAGPGYDMVTGLGSVDGYNLALHLATQWSTPAIALLNPSSVIAGGGTFTLAVNGSGFDSESVVEWMGIALPTTVVSATQVFATVSGSLIAVAGSAAVTVVGAHGSSAAASLVISPSFGVVFNSQRVTTTPPPASGCGPVPPPLNFFMPTDTVYLFFNATVAISDSLTYDWVTPNGGIVQASSWPASSGFFCFNNAGSLVLNNLGLGQVNGVWQARVFDHGSLLFSIPFAVNVLAGNPFPAAGQVVSASGSSEFVNLTLPANYPWTASSGVNWITFLGSNAGEGSATLGYQVAANVGAARTGAISIGNFSFTVQQDAAISGLNFIGSMPHLAAEENWTTTFTLVNKGSTPTQARLSLFGDAGGELTLPLVLPQQSAVLGPLLATSIEPAISANASLIVNSAGPQTPPVETGSAQLAAAGPVDGFAIFHLIPGAQEAVVPLETRSANSYLLAYDNTGGVVLGIALANVSAQAANIGVVIRDDSGSQIGTATLAMPANSHTSFVLSTLYPVTTDKRGTIQFNTPAGGQISVLGIRTTPLGNSKTLTTIPALANTGSSGGSIAHIAVSNGWQTTFVLVNAAEVPSAATLKFFDDAGNPLPLSISYPQLGGGAATVSSVNPTLGAGAMLMIVANGPLANPVQIGSAQLTTTGNVSGFVIFRYNPNGQEAVVPLENRNAPAYILAFDNTAGTATGVALNSASAQAANVAVTIRDDAGTKLLTDMLNLAANGHLSFTLGTDKYPATTNIRGTIEFDAPPGAQIGALGIRIPVAHTFTTLPALAR